MNMPWKNSTPRMSPLAIQQGAAVAAAFQAPAIAAPKPNDNFASLIDELGTIKAIISKAEKREKVLLELIKPLGDGDHNGGKCYAHIATSPRATFDKKGLEAAHPDLVAAFTTDKPVTTVTIKALV